MAGTTTYTFRFDEDGNIISLVDAQGIFLDRERGKKLARSISTFYAMIGDLELDSYVEESRRRQEELERARYANNNGDKPGYIYLVETYDGFIKIGQSIAPHERIKSFNLPYKPKLLHKLRTSDMDTAEKYLHQKYAHRRADGEWFLLSGEELSWLMSRDTLEIGPAGVEVIRMPIESPEPSCEATAAL